MKIQFAKKLIFLIMGSFLLQGCNLFGEQVCYTNIEFENPQFTSTKISESIDWPYNERTSIKNNGMQTYFLLGATPFFFEEQNSADIKQQTLIVSSKPIPEIHPTAPWSGKISLSPFNTSGGEHSNVKVTYNFIIDLKSGSEFMYYTGSVNANIQPKYCYDED